MEIVGRKVKMFRAHYDPIIGPMPKNAYDLSDPNSPIDLAELTPMGVFIKMKPLREAKNGEFVEHLLPYANIQSIKLFPHEEVAPKKIGRPFKETNT